VDWAVRIARNYTRRDTVVTFSNSLHGRTYLSANLSGIDRRKVGFGVQAPGIITAPYPECASCPLKLKKEKCGFACIDEIDRLIENHEASDPAAVLIEPFIGSTGMIFPPEGYLSALRKWTKKKNAVLIFDEIQTGYGKIGSLFAYQRINVKPDVLVIGKGMGNGLHIAGLLAKDQILTRLNGRALAGGTGHSVLETEGASAVLDIIRNEKWLDHVLDMEKLIIPLMERLVAHHDCVDNYRGCGVAYGIELVTDMETREKNETLAEELVENAYHQGLRLGRWENVLFFRPPIIVTAEQIHRYFSVLEDLLSQLC
jgi:4-aminobutyrate aminotransferase-like enzyme